MLTDDLNANADSRPREEAIVYGGERLSWADLAERVERLAHGLTAAGVAPGDPVALLLPNSTDFVSSWLAITGIGAVVVPLNPVFKADELEFLFRSSGVRAVIGDEGGAAVSASIAERWDNGLRLITTGPARDGALAFDRLIEEHTGPRLPARGADEDYVFQFSSGSTGRPKRVARTHGQCRAEADSYMAAMEITPADRIFCAIPLFHTYGMGNCLTTFVRTGSTLVIMEEPNPFILHRERALRLLERERASIFPGVPFNFRLLGDLDVPADLSALRLCFSAGTALPRPAFDSFLDRHGVAVRQLYGSTETGVMTTNVDPDPVATAASVGTPTRGLTVKVVDDDGASLPAGNEGEIAVSGPAMARGYADDEEQSRAAFRDGYYFTGDLGRLDAEGRLFVTGRKKLFIEVAGNKVDPVEVEDVLAGHPKVREAVVVGVKGRVDGEEMVKAAIVAVDGCGQREVVTYCRERLANFKVPQIVEFREEIPRSPLGKILRKYLIE